MVDEVKRRRERSFQNDMGVPVRRTQDLGNSRGAAS
jgi:hypothetical protein